MQQCFQGRQRKCRPGGPLQLQASRVLLQTFKRPRSRRLPGWLPQRPQANPRHRQTYGDLAADPAADLAADLAADPAAGRLCSRDPWAGLAADPAADLAADLAANLAAGRSVGRPCGKQALRQTLWQTLWQTLRDLGADLAACLGADLAADLAAAPQQPHELGGYKWSIILNNYPHGSIIQGKCIAKSMVCDSWGQFPLSNYKLYAIRVHKL